MRETVCAGVILSCNRRHLVTVDLRAACKIPVRSFITAFCTRRVFASVDAIVVADFFVPTISTFSRCHSAAASTLIIPFNLAGFLVGFAFRTVGLAFRSQRKRLAFKNRYVSFLRRRCLRRRSVVAILVLNFCSFTFRAVCATDRAC